MDKKKVPLCRKKISINIKSKRKGFTLVELLGVIAILAVVIGLTVMMFINVRKNILKKEYENVISLVETKAALYANDTGITTVSIEKLINEGYLDPDDETDIYNPQDNTSMNCYVFRSELKNEEYIATILSANGRKEDGTCDAYEETSDLYICVMDSDGNCNKTVKSWYADNVTLGVRFGNGTMVPDQSKYEWTSNIGTTGTEATLKTKASTVSLGTYKVRVIMPEKIGEAKKDINIDKEKPAITDVDFDSVWSKEKTLTIHATDYNGSGVKGIYVGNSSTCTPSLNYENAVNNAITKKLAEGEYNACVIDNVGNVSNKPYKIKVDYVDKTGADSISLTPSTTVWVQSLNLYGKATDTRSGLVEYAFTTNALNPSNWTKISRTRDTEQTLANIRSNGIYYFWVKDAVGNVSKTSYDVRNIDNNIDSVRITSSTNDWVTSLRLTGNATDNKSGIIKYQFTTQNRQPTSWKTVTNTSSTTQYYDISQNGTYYFWVMDAAGNVASSSIYVGNIGKLYTKVVDPYSRNSSNIHDSVYIPNIKKIVNVTTDTGYASNYYISGNYVYYTVSGGRTYTDEEWDYCTEPSQSRYADEREGECLRYECYSGGYADRWGYCQGEFGPVYELRGDPYDARCYCKNGYVNSCSGSANTPCPRGYYRDRYGEDVPIYYYPGYDQVMGDSCDENFDTTLYGIVNCYWDEYRADCRNYETIYECDWDEELDGRWCYSCRRGELINRNRLCEYSCLVPFNYWEYRVTISYIAP